jgi:hypothetical protein
MPRDTHKSFKIEQGKPWRYADFTAPFDFPIYKSDAILKAQCDSVLQDFEPYYTLKSEVGITKVREFLQIYNKETKGWSTDFKSVVANRLMSFYEKGIVDTKEPVGGENDTTHLIRVVSGKTAQSIHVRETFTPKQAYEALISDEALERHRDLVSNLNLNDFIAPNLFYDKERSETSMQELISTVPKASGVAQRGEKIIDRGTIVDEQKYLILNSFLKDFWLTDLRHVQNPANRVGFPYQHFILMVSAAGSVFPDIQLGLQRKQSSQHPQTFLRDCNIFRQNTDLLLSRPYRNAAEIRKERGKLRDCTAFFIRTDPGNFIFYIT